MYRSLSSFEKKNMFTHTRIKIEKDSSGLENDLVISMHDKEDSNLPSCDILQFTKFDSDKRVLITDLRSADNELEHLHDVYFAICEKTIERFLKLMLEGNFKKLTIFTKDAVMQEILLERKFSILKSLSNRGIVATLSI